MLNDVSSKNQSEVTFYQRGGRNATDRYLTTWQMKHYSSVRLTFLFGRTDPLTLSCTERVLTHGSVTCSHLRKLLTPASLPVVVNNHSSY